MATRRVAACIFCARSGLGAGALVLLAAGSAATAPVVVLPLPGSSTVVSPVVLPLVRAAAGSPRVSDMRRSQHMTGRGTRRRRGPRR
jgi:hypothetical protein